MTYIAERIRKYLNKHRMDRKVRYTATVLASMVIFITTYMLIYPALTLEQTADCGIEEHEHTASCYSSEIVCGLEESPGHVHTDECYQTEAVLICGMEEHVHESTCYEESVSLICGLDEYEGHEHTDACYAQVLSCDKEVHVHSVSYYEVVETEVPAEEAEYDLDQDEDYIFADGNVSEQPETLEDIDSEYQESENLEQEYQSDEGQEGSTLLPPIDFAENLTDLTSLWYQNPDGTWSLVGKETVFDPETYVLVHIAYDIPQGSLDAGNSQIIYKLPESFMVSAEDAEMANTDENNLNQLVTGCRLPDEELTEGVQEYLAGKYILGQDETGRWQINITFQKLI